MLTAKRAKSYLYEKKLIINVEADIEVPPLGITMGIEFQMLILQVLFINMTSTE